MLSREAALAAVRYGTGLRPGEAPPEGAPALLASLDLPRPPLAGAPQPTLADRFALRAARQDVLKELRQLRRDGRELDTVKERQREAQRPIVEMLAADLGRLIDRTVRSPAGFAERLVSFWSDHFTAANNKPWNTILTIDMVETAIRPHVGGRFPDMLRAVTLHPAMLVYLDQAGSVGPNSRAGSKRGRGLNENLAREVLELHTLGVKGGYTQADVRQFAELLTGLTVDRGGFQFRPAMAEPGAETVLGRSYGGRKAQLSDIEMALDDIALHPETARHLATKLCIHFIGGTPDPAQVEAMARAYLKSDGGMRPMLRAMLGHPEAWTPELRKAKTPFDFVVSALRALDGRVPGASGLPLRDLRRGFLEPLADMGQPMFQPNAPDGWPEEPEAWITPAGLTARLIWAGRVTKEYARDLDPRGFVETALGPLASDTLRQAAAGSETRAEGVALVLASPEFNRR